MTVLIVADPQDTAAARVREHLDACGAKWAQLDLAEFPQRASVSALLGGNRHGGGHLTTASTSLPLTDIHAVYYRKPHDFTPPDHLVGEQRRHALTEARRGFGGILLGLPARWVSHPARVAHAEFKPGQLRMAHDLGLRTPRTLITNDPGEARRFVTDVEAIYKPLGAGALVTDEGLKFIYATRVSVSDIDDDIALTANLFQEWVPKRYDVRLTVVGDDCFAAIVRTTSSAGHLDWRSDYPGNTYEPVDTPPEIASAATEYLRQFGLSFGAFDFVVSAEGDWVFLECNANGQWDWIEAETGLPISAAVANLLMREI